MKEGFEKIGNDHLGITDNAHTLMRQNYTCCLQILLFVFCIISNIKPDIWKSPTAVVEKQTLGRLKGKKNNYTHLNLEQRLFPTYCTNTNEPIPASFLFNFVFSTFYIFDKLMKA